MGISGLQSNKSACTRCVQASWNVPARGVIARDYGSWGISLVVVVVTGMLVSICVLLHYEVLNVLSYRLARLEGRHRRRTCSTMSTSPR